MKTMPDGSRTCVDHMIGCGPGLFINDQMECKPCHDSCVECISGGPQHCTQCTPDTQLLFPARYARAFREHMENEFDVHMGFTDLNITYEPGDNPEQFVFGSCHTETSCNIPGFALWNDNGICMPCESLGCSECDATGICTACDRRLGLSLTVEEDGSAECIPCLLESFGCKFCAADNPTQCQVCKKGYALKTDQYQYKYCVRNCDEGWFAKEVTAAPSDVPFTTTELTHEVCTECDTSVCAECKTSANFCLLCKIAGNFAQPDGT